MLTSDKIDSNAIEQSNWSKVADAFTSDELIQAYLDGKEAGRMEEQRILMEHVKKSVQKAKQIGEQIFAVAKDKSFELISMYLKADDAVRYKILFVAEEADFLQPEFSQLYIQARRISREYEEENFHFSFSFMPAPQQFDDAGILSNGYFLKYGQGSKTGARAA